MSMRLYALLGLLCVLGAARADEWTLTGTTYNASDWRAQPYVANGYIGQRIPAAGFGYYEIQAKNASGHDGTSGWPLFDARFTAAMVAGFYDQQDNTTGTNFDQTGGEQPISTLPTWSPLYLTLNGATLLPTVPASSVANYSQSLSIADGVVTTSFTWQNVSVKYTLFAHRARANLGVVRLDVDGLPAGARVGVSDVLDGAGAWRTTPVASGTLPNTTDGTIYSALKPNGISNVTAYLVSATTLSSSESKFTPSNDTAFCAPVPVNASSAYQCFAANSTGGAGKFSAVKYVGIASSDAFKGRELDTARGAVTSARKEGYASLLASHRAAWSALWAESDVIVPSTDGQSPSALQKAARASLFHLLSNVREGSEGPGVGDNSIAPAGLTSDSYAGQVFWDADVWMAPSLTALFPSYAESITNFRSRQLGAAIENSKKFNRSGGLYPWTAGRFGNCTGVGPCYDYEYHLENDIALAQYQYYAATQNRTWLAEKGWPVIKAVAEFWASQVVSNRTGEEGVVFDTYNETDPDEFANFRNNAAYTNAGITVVLQNAISLAGILGEAVPSNWSKIAKGITVLSDNSSRITLEYDGFNASTAVKQADVILLTYPLEYNQSTERGLENLDFYAGATSPDGPGMTYSVFSIDASALSPTGCASYTYLLGASQPYSRAPFFQFSEQTTDDFETNGGTNPAFTFLTGHGGFLQSFTHGFTGYRARLNAFYLDPVLPPQLTNYTVKGMRFAGSTFDVTLTTNHTTIVRRKGTGSSAPVEIGPGNAKAGNYTLKVGQSLVVPTRTTNGTLVEGNVAQCKSVLADDTDFGNVNASIVPGQYALAAIDGANATAWQPSTNASSTMTIDLHASHKIKGFHINWGNKPARSYLLQAGSSPSNMTSLASGFTSISAPYNASTAAEVRIRLGNLTDVPLNATVNARYVNFTIEGSWGEDGAGGTVAEIAVLS